MTIPKIYLNIVTTTKEVLTMKTTLLLTLLLTLISCNKLTLKGTLLANNDLVLKDENGDDVSIPSGTYRATVKAKKKQEIELSLEQGDWEGEFDFDLPETQLSPNGDFFISSQDSGQPYDIAGTYKTSTKIIDTTLELRSCIYYYYHYPYGWRRYWGRRAVEYDVHKTTTKSHIDMMATATEDVHAAFSGRRTKVRHIERYRGPCRIY